jgi:hypothetical protein
MYRTALALASFVTLGAGVAHADVVFTPGQIQVTPPRAAYVPPPPQQPQYAQGWGWGHRRPWAYNQWQQTAQFVNRVRTEEDQIRNEIRAQARLGRVRPEVWQQLQASRTAIEYTLASAQRDGYIDWQERNNVESYLAQMRNLSRSCHENVVTPYGGTYGYNTYR